MLTTAQAAELLGVSRRRVNELIDLGTIKAEKPGRDWLVDEASVEAYKNSPRKAGRKPRDTRFSSSQSAGSGNLTTGGSGGLVAPTVAPGGSEGERSGGAKRPRRVTKG